MEASEPKWVNSDDIQYAVNSLRLGGLLIIFKLIDSIYNMTRNFLCVAYKCN